MLDIGYLEIFVFFVSTRIHHFRVFLHLLVFPEQQRATLDIHEPSGEDIVFYINAYRCIKNLEMLGDSCKENIIIEKNIFNISMKSGGLYDDYDFPKF